MYFSAVLGAMAMEAADGGDDVDIAAEDGFILQFFKDGVELVLLLLGEEEDDIRGVLEFSVEVNAPPKVLNYVSSA